MAEPKIEVLTSRPAVPVGGAVVDVLVRITPPVPDVHFVRPPINLGLVLDRSGSMAGARKMAYARDAAAFAVEQLLPTDQVSITIFDNIVETIVASAPAANKPAIVEKIKGIQARNATALHAGWKEGADQVERHLVPSGLNRVVLLSDGLANEGVTDPNVIADECKARAARGVSTTTMGLGDDYNEDLMQRMGENGDGNYYFIETPQQLADIFHTELKGLMANLGTKVSLGVETQGGSTISEVLNDMDRGPLGRLMLPNLVVGMPIQVVLRLSVPALDRSCEVARFRLAWDNPKTGERQSIYAGLTLPVVAQAQWEAMASDEAVAEQVAFQMAARAKKEAIARSDAGDYAGSSNLLAAGMAYMAGHESPQANREVAQMREIQGHLGRGEVARFRKKALWQTSLTKKGTEPEPPTEGEPPTSP